MNDDKIISLQELLAPAFCAAFITSDLLEALDVVLVADRFLFDLPLHALPVFAKASVTQDYSLHLLYHRICSSQKPKEVGQVAAFGKITMRLNRPHPRLGLAT